MSIEKTIAVASIVAILAIFFTAWGISKSLTITIPVKMTSIAKTYCKDGNLVFLVESRDGSRQWTKAGITVPCTPREKGE